MRACFTGEAIAVLAQHINALLSWVRGQNLFPAGDVLEIYHIDNRFTGREEEFFTELQVRAEEREVQPLV